MKWRETIDTLGAAPRQSAGFTLLELLVVMVIIGLLASYVGPPAVWRDREIRNQGGARAGRCFL